MKRLMISAVLLVLMTVSTQGMVGVDQSDGAMADLVVLNLSKGVLQGSNVAQWGGTVVATDGVSSAGASESGVLLQGITVAGRGVGHALTLVKEGQSAGGSANVSGAGQGLAILLDTGLVKLPGPGGIMVQNSAVTNQTEQVVTPTTSILNSNTAAASTIAGAGPGGKGTVSSTVAVESTQQAVAVAECPIDPCPEPEPPCIP